VPLDILALPPGTWHIEFTALPAFGYSLMMIQAFGASKMRFGRRGARDFIASAEDTGIECGKTNKRILHKPGGLSFGGTKGEP